jgi:mannobiose 2-epimerase
MILDTLKQEVEQELKHNILHFWETRMMDEQGGFYGQITGDNKLEKDAPRGGILNARILWTFSSAARIFKSDCYQKVATHAKNYIFNHFFDDEFGGTYWTLNADGSPHDTKKQIYSQAFFIYALVEYYRLTGDNEALIKAKSLFLIIEKYSFDKVLNGYFEAYSKDWILLEDMRLSEKDANEKKTMNTHLHILEAYTNLYRVWKDPLLEQQIQNLIQLFLEKIVNKNTGHLDLFFDENWVCKSSVYSFGHDIEASWLLEEAAKVLGKPSILKKVRAHSLIIARAASEGLLDNGAMMYELNCETGHLNSNCDWWPQAEAMVGYMNAYQLTQNEFYLEYVLKNWAFVKACIIDHEHGEWYNSVDKDGVNNPLLDKAGFWKCPYHNGRMGLELIERINTLQS